MTSEERSLIHALERTIAQANESLSLITHASGHLAYADGACPKIASRFVVNLLPDWV